ncbi:unnamed protein product [Trichobilharzia regenti]|nr:unnamed protein product [Trichobilharzia regenti]
MKLLMTTMVMKVIETMKMWKMKNRTKRESLSTSH